MLQTFIIKNNGDRAVAVVRINFLPLAHMQLGLKFSPTHPAITYDYDAELRAHETKMFSLHNSGLPRTAKPLATGPVPCDVIAVRYTDGTTWSIVRGIATP